MAAPKYELSAHAATAIAERDIELAWLERVLASPNRVESGTLAPELMSALGKIAECGGRVLRVVYNPNVEPVRIVTVYFDRGLRGKL